LEGIKIYQGLCRYRYRYRSQDNQHYILAFFELTEEGVSCAKWSLYYCQQEEQPLLEQTCTSEDFHNVRFLSVERR
jgi:hypothetical protein